ncbi:hypothetical protein H1R17_13435 [Flavobacterium sp. xlx-214]|uniref:hypothetical protein n=1 Tax=unclassified Flavobacterium TaxID=196869 RepID=UPI0013D41EFA|nr:MULTISPECIES: hypothetical protein [unclassified Flavobacterium]MBA5791405.1 hypothetical protein [Flavobacterium sp. xlx-221]QMI83443.1 hypothetical protein H1R17_13435 [Flavobacterium sp. xlx-214]
MKKYLYIVLSLLAFNTWQANAQIEDTDMDELVIDKLSRANIIEIIKKVRNQMYNNYASNNYQYFVSHQATINDTAQLLKTDVLYNVSINLKNKKINKSVVKDPMNKISMDTLFFNRYSGNDSPMYWLTEIVIRKYVNVPELDFFNNFKDYMFTRKKAKNGQYVIEFYSDDFYEGYFQYDQNFNLKKMEFELLKPYPIDHSQSKNGKFMFEKSWLYKKEKVAITFVTNAEGKNVVDELKAYEEIDDYNFTRFNSVGEVMIKDTDLDFKSNLVFKRK